MQEGIVLKSLGQLYEVLTKSGAIVSCTLKGNLRMKTITTTNPAVVGDTVTIDETAPNEFVITEVAPRKNYIIRRSKKTFKAISDNSLKHRQGVYFGNYHTSQNTKFFH